MNRSVLSLDAFTNYDTTTAAEYAMIMLRRARKVGYHTTRAPLIADDGFLACWSADYELTVRDGNEWVSIQSGVAGKWRLSRGGPPPGLGKFVKKWRDKRKPAPNMFHTRGSSVERVVIDNIAPVPKHPTVDFGGRTDFVEVQAMAERETQMIPVETMTKATQTIVRLEKLQEMRRAQDAAQRHTLNVGSGTQPPAGPAQQVLTLLVISTTAQALLDLSTSIVADPQQLLHQSNILLKNIQIGLIRLRKLEAINEHFRGLREFLMRVSSAVNPVVMKKAVEIQGNNQKIEEETVQLQGWINEKQRLDDQIAGLLEV